MKYVVLLSLLFLNGCGAIVATGAVAYRNDLAPRQQAAFKADFEQRNAQREKDGQEPVKWCDALFRYNKRWYFDDTTCR